VHVGLADALPKHPAARLWLSGSLFNLRKHLVKVVLPCKVSLSLNFLLPTYFD